VPKEKALDRRSWPVRVFRLGEEPRDDLSGSTTAEQRLAMVWPLTLEAWALAGLPIPTYARHETPISSRFVDPTGDSSDQP
jgi:hypothetical protein